MTMDRTDNLADYSTPAVPAGTVLLGTYLVEDRISQGGMGEVYKGLDQASGQPVAIKIVLPHLAEDPDIVALFEKEAGILQKLDHSSIVKFHKFAHDQCLDRPCLVMEFVNGENGEDILKNGPMPEINVRCALRQLAEALSLVHAEGTVHRDLNPRNVLISMDDSPIVKIIDFGIAKSTIQTHGSGLNGQFAGTLDFVSPEQLGGFGGQVDKRADIYSLGLLAVAYCRGAVMPMGDDVVGAVAARRGVPDISDVYPSLRPLLTLMLAPNPDHRPPSMERLIEFLDMPADKLAASVPVVGEPTPSDYSVEFPSSSAPRARGNARTSPPGEH